MNRTLFVAAMALACISPASALEIKPQTKVPPGTFCIMSAGTQFCSDNTREMIPHHEGNLQDGEMCLKGEGNSFCLRPVSRLVTWPGHPQDYNGIVCDPSGLCSAPLSRMEPGAPSADALYRGHVFANPQSSDRNCNLLSDGRSLKPTC